MYRPVVVLQVVIDRLVSSACFSQQRGLSLQPLSGYQVLYDFLLAWGNYKHAAAAMLSYARRLRSMAAAAAAGSSASDKQQLQEMVTEVQAAYGESCIVLNQPCSPALLAVGFWPTSCERGLSSWLLASGSLLIQKTA